MATGAGDEYWEKQALPSVFKHALLDKYVPQFAGMTSSRAGRRVVFLDGYAGRGRYENGQAGSAERILQIAEHQMRSVGLAWTCYFVERDAESARVLIEVVNEYATRGVNAVAHHGDIADTMPRVLDAATGAPLFLFLDPTGLGLPYETLTKVLSGQRAGTWPPTEVLFNFSLEAVRRIGGHIASAHRNETSVARLDAAVGGTWWHRYFSGGVTDDGVERLVESFAAKLSGDTDMAIVSVPVRRAPGHKALYHLIFGTRSNHGLWVFGDSVARATQAWWDSLEEVEAAEDPHALFAATTLIRPALETIETRAVPVIADNLAELLRQYDSYKVVDHPRAVFGEYFGSVRDPVVRAAVNLLNTQGRTSSTGVGVKRPRDIVVRRP